MTVKFTLLFLLQRYPDIQHQAYYNDEILTDADVAELFRNAEQQVSKSMLDRIYIQASDAVAHR
ncbi:MAG: hypothetical protein LBS09_00420 [Bacteroidales bacterium]|jgi:hypothetical protein|nr:hypothetical protein [Bacteroidales bacterium]